MWTASRSWRAPEKYANCLAWGEKHEQKLIKAIEDYRRIGAATLIDVAESRPRSSPSISRPCPASTSTPAGSLRRGRETVGDLDILVTGKVCVDDTAAPTPSGTSPKLPAPDWTSSPAATTISFRRAQRHAGGRPSAIRPPPSAQPAILYRLKAHNVASAARHRRWAYTLASTA